MQAGVWPSLFAKCSASLAPDCCSRKCMTRKRPRRAAKCSKVSCGLTSAEETRGGRDEQEGFGFGSVSVPHIKGRTELTKTGFGKASKK